MQRSEWVEALFEKHHGRLVRYAARLTGDLDAARDAVQETFMQLCQMDPSALDSQPVPWLYTVCRNRALDRRRKEARMNSVGVDVEEMPAAPDAAPSPLRLLETRSATSAILKALVSLPANQQEVIRLKFQDGMSYREISEITGLSVSNVGFLIHVGIKGIRAAVNGGSGDATR